MVNIYIRQMILLWYLIVRDILIRFSGNLSCIQDNVDALLCPQCRKKLLCLQRCTKGQQGPNLCFDAGRSMRTYADNISPELGTLLPSPVYLGRSALERDFVKGEPNSKPEPISSPVKSRNDPRPSFYHSILSYIKNIHRFLGEIHNPMTACFFAGLLSSCSADMSQ